MKNPLSNSEICPSTKSFSFDNGRTLSSDNIVYYFCNLVNQIEPAKPLNQVCFNELRKQNLNHLIREYLVRENMLLRIQLYFY